MAKTFKKFCDEACFDPSPAGRQVLALLWDAAILSQKPSDCTCRYPEVVMRNVHGHSSDCPFTKRFKME